MSVGIIVNFIEGVGLIFWIYLRVKEKLKKKFFFGGYLRLDCRMEILFGDLVGDCYYKSLKYVR